MKNRIGTDTERFFERLDAIEELPTLPEVAVRLGRLLEDEGVTAERVALIMENDPAIVPKILKLVNCAFFGLRTQISNLSHAVVVLGFQTIRNVVTALSVIDAFAEKALPPGFSFRRFWVHAISVGAVSRHMAGETGIVPADDAFTAGLLHDIGKLVMAHHFRDEFRVVWNAAARNGTAFFEEEKRRLPVTHARIGGYLVERWRFPRELVASIRWHHEVGTGGGDREMTVLLHAADALVNRAGAPDTGRLPPVALPPETRRELRAMTAGAEDWFPALRETIREACRIFIQETRA